MFRFTASLEDSWLLQRYLAQLNLIQELALIVPNSHPCTAAPTISRKYQHELLTRLAEVDYTPAVEAPPAGF
jgi:hypothetical protein